MLHHINPMSCPLPTTEQLLDPNNHYSTMLHLAVLKRCDPEVIEALISHGAPLAHRNTQRDNFMDVLLQTGYPHALQVCK